MSGACVICGRTDLDCHSSDNGKLIYCFDPSKSGGIAENADHSYAHRLKRLCGCGEKHPLPAPAVAAAPAGAPPDADGAPEPVFVRLADVTAKPAQWIWPGRIPLGKLTVLDGDPGVGKSLITVDLAARVSTGREMPDGTHGDVKGPAGVVMLSAEDDPADTIRPRFDVAGGDPSKVVILQAARYEVEGHKRERAITLADVDTLRQVLSETHAALIVVDPVMAYLGSDTDAHVDADIRSLLAPLATLAAETCAAIVLIRHLRKSGGANPLYAGGGSIGIIGAARSGLLVARDPDDAEGTRRILCSTKCNLAPEPASLAYEIETIDNTPRIKWLGTVEHTAASIMAAIPEDAEERGVLSEAKRFLRELLSDGPQPAETVQAEAKKAGISARTFRRAKVALGVRSRKSGFGEEWVWSLPDTQGKESGHLGPLRPNGPETLENSTSTEDGQVATLGERAANGQEDHQNPKMSKAAKPHGVGALCAYPTHLRAWRGHAGQLICAECHPPQNGTMIEEIGR